MRAAAILVALAACTPAPSDTVKTPDSFGAAVARVEAVAERLMQLPEAPPGYAIVVVAKGRTPVVRAYGVRNADTRAPVTPDTPFYIASITKSYTGLLAAELDRRDVLSLDATLADVWPDLVLPRELTAQRVSLRAWMLHQAPLINDTLETRTSYIGRVPLPDYPVLLRSYSRPRDAGFGYSNAGYLVYAAALERRTGHDLEWWLEREVLRPLRLDRTSMRTSRTRDWAWGHQRIEHGWNPLRPKPDALMHAAGGLIASPNDIGAWMLASMDPDRQGSLAAAFTAAQTPAGPVHVDRRGFACDGYSFGWFHCDYRGLRLMSHGGGYTGMSALMTISPEAGVGIALLSNAETAGLSFNSRLTREFLDAWIGGEQQSVPAVVAAFAGEMERLARNSERRTAEIMAQPRWGGWTWSPTTRDLIAVCGRYASDRLGEMIVARDGATLSAQLGEMRFSLRPAAQDLFAATQVGDERPGASFRVERGQNGRVVALQWDDDRFEHNERQCSRTPAMP